MRAKVTTTEIQPAQPEAPEMPAPSSQGAERTLLPSHRQVLEEGSGISPEVIAERGYWSAEQWPELEGLAFRGTQKVPESFPALMIPHHDPGGLLTYHVMRYDRPRVTRDGKVIKYEQPGGIGLRLDVPLRCLGSLRDPDRTLWFTEGAKKADALASHDIIAVNTPGVDGWRSPGAIADLFGIPFKSKGKEAGPRTVVLAYDSDVMTKPRVRYALIALAGWTKQKGADVQVIDWEKADLPQGGKTGVDDYLVAHDIDDLYELLTPFGEWVERTKPAEGSRGCPYRATSEGIEWLKPDKQGLGNPETVRLSNFAAKINADIAEDDGVDVKRVFEITTLLKERARTFRVPAEKFTAMNWVTEQLGATAILYPGNGTKDHARAAVQLLSGDVLETVRFTHLGWRQIGEKWFYLHAGGAIGAEGAVDGVDVAITGALSNYQLPNPPEGEDLARAIRASLEILEVAPREVMVPLLAAPYRAVIGGVDHSIHLAGSTGAGKSVLAALVQQHFGPGMDGRNLPAGWSSTGNALEMLAFLAKDAVLTVDDFVPTGSSADVAKLNRDAERLFRGQGNQSGRQRLTADATLRAGKPPRGMVLSTGEDVPRGQSLRARLLVLEVSPEDIKWKKVTRCQRAASAGVYARVLAAFIKWLAPRYAATQAALLERIATLRAAAYKGSLHRRVPEIVANLAVGLSDFLAFALDAGAFTEEECQTLWESWWQALQEPAARQASHQANTEPARRFMELLGAAVRSGQAHLTSVTGDAPTDADAWGWQRNSVMMPGYVQAEEWRPQGPWIGWTDGDELYLDPVAAFAAAQSLGSRMGEPLLISSQTLKKRLKEQNLLASVDPDRGSLTVRRRYRGEVKPRNVLHIHSSSLGTSGKADISDISDISLPPSWRATSNGKEMSGSGSEMSGEMSGFPGDSSPDGQAETGPFVPEREGVRERNVGNVGNVGLNEPTPPETISSGVTSLPGNVGLPLARAPKPDISGFTKPDIGEEEEGWE